MAIIVTVEIAGGTRELFEAVSQQAGSTMDSPGGLFRAAGPIPGGWRVLSGWESREAYEAFVRDKLQPAWQQAGVRPTRIEIWQDVEVRAPSGTTG